MSIKTKWIGLEAYGLKLFLIKNRFFMSGDGIDQNTNKLLALGFREVPKSAFKEGARSYWSAPSESDFLRRVVAAFPDYTVQMLPPEGINPTILVNRNQNFKGGIKNEEQQPTERTNNTGQRVVEAASGNLYAGADTDATVLVGAGTPNDSGDQSSVNVGDGRGAELPSVADKDSRELRAGGADVSGAVESAQSADGLSEPAGASELAQPSEDGESRGLSEQPSAELGAELADERGSRLRLLSDNDARLISNAMDRRYALVERLSGDTVMLAQHVATAIEGGDASRHAEFRKAYDSLEAQEQAFDLSALFYDTDRKDGVFAPLALMDDGNLTVGRAREVLSGAGYGWLAEHIKPVLSFSADDSKDQIAVDRVKQIIVDRFAEEAGVTGSQAEIDTDERELQSRVGRAALLASLMELSRIEAAKPQIEVEAEPELDAAGQDDKSVDAKSIRAAHQSLVVAVHGFKDTVASLKNGIASVDQSRNFTDADALVFQYEKTRTSLDSLNLASHFFDADEKIGVAAVFDNFDGLGTKIDAAKVVFDNAGYGDLFDVAWGANSLHTATETISIDRLKSWVLDVLVREQGLESVAPSSPFDDDLSDSVQEFWGMAGQIESIKTALAEMALSLEQAAADRDAAVDDAPVENNDLDIVRKSFDQLASDSATFAVEVAGLKEAAQEAISSSDYSKAEALKAAHVTLMDTVQRLELSRYFFENTDGKGVASAFSNLEEGGAYVEGGIDIDLAKLAFQDAGYGDLFESSIVAHTLFTKERTILLDDLKAVIVDGIANDADVGRAAVESVAVYDAIEQASVSLQDITHGLRQFSAAALQASEDAGEDADDVDTLNIHEAHRLRSLDIDQHLQDLAVLKGDVVRVLGSQNFAWLQEVAFEHESLARVASLATIENYFFDKSNGAGVTSVFSSFDETEIPVAHARRTFVDAGYGDLFDSSIQARELFNKSDFISIDDLKFWVTSAVEFQAGINTDLEEYQSVDEALASIKNDLDVIAGQIASMGDARSALRLAQDSRLLADNPSNFRLADFLWMAQVERLENHGRKWGVTYGLYSAFSDADDTQRAIADVHSGAVNNAIYFQLPDSNNHSGVPMPRDEVLADYPDLIEKFVDVFAVDRPEVAAAVDKGVDLVAAYHVLGSDIYVYESREKDSKVYLSGVVGDDLEVDNLTMRESLLGAIASATDAYTRLNNLGTVIGSDEGLDDAAIIDTVGDGDEPDAGAGVVDASISELDAEQQEAEQDSSAGNDNAPLDIVKRMADMGYPINTDALNPFEGISEAHRELLAKATVVVTDRELYKDFVTPRTGAQTQTLIMNAPRPMMGGVEFEADFFAGRYYALVDTTESSADFQIKTNAKMDATLPVYMDGVTRVAFALHSNRYASSYLEMLESGEASIEEVRAEVVKHRDYTIETLEAALSEFKASFAADTSLSQEATKEPVAGAVFNLNDHPFNFTLAEWSNVAVAARELTQSWSIKHGAFTDTVESASDSEDALSVSHRESVRGALELNLSSSSNGMNVPIPSGTVLLDYPLLVEEYADAFLVERPDAKAALEADGLALAAYSVYGYEIYEITGFPTNGNREAQYFIQSHANKLAGLSDVYGDEGNYIVYGFSNALLAAREQLLKANRQLGLADSSSRNLEAQVDEVAELSAVVGVETPAVDSRVTSESAGNSRQGDIVRTDDGAEYLLMRARFDFVEAHPIIDGKSQVSADSAVRFHLNPDNADTRPNRDHRVILHTGRNYYDEQSAALAAKTGQTTEAVEPDAVESSQGFANEAPAFASDDGADNTGIGSKLLNAADVVSIDSINIYRAHNARKADLELVLGAVSALKAGVLGDIESKSYSKIGSHELERESLKSRVDSLAIENYFFEQSDGAGVAKVFASFDADEIPLDHAKRAFVGAGYGDLFDSSIQARELFNKSDFISINDLKFWVTSAVEFQAGINTDLEEYQSVDEALANIKDDLDVITGQIASMRSAEHLALEESAAEMAGAAMLISREDQEADQLLADNPSNLTLEQYRGVAKVEDVSALTNGRQQWRVTNGFHVSYSSAISEQDAVTGAHRRAVSEALYYHQKDKSNFSGVAMPRDEVLADYPDLVESFIDVFAVDRLEVANSMLAAGIALSAAYRVFGTDVYERSLGGDSTSYFSATDEAAEKNTFDRNETLADAIGGAIAAYRIRYGLDVSVGSGEGFDDAAIVDTAGDGDAQQETNQVHIGGGSREGESFDNSSSDSAGYTDSLDTAPAEYVNDDEDEDGGREWAGLTLQDLKNTELNSSMSSFRGAVAALVKTEEDGDLLELPNRAKQALLSFTGWGGLHEDYRMGGRRHHVGRAISSDLGMDEDDFHNAVMVNRLESYYTPADVIESMWKAVQQAGVPANGKVLEPSVGSGHFFVGAPANVQALGTLIGIDCDSIAVRFARASAPDARIIESRFENVVLDNSFDVVIGNVPFGSTRISDSRYPKPKLIHDYFIERSLSHLKDGGLMAVITTSGTMDKADDETRANIMATADLVAGVRLPSSVFSRDNAKVVTDILVFQKRPAGTEPSRDFTATTMVDVQGEEFRINDFFVDNPQFILGDVVTTSSQFGPKMDVAGKLEGIGERIDAAIASQIAAPIFDKTNWAKAGASDEAASESWADDAYEADSSEFTSRLIGEISILNGKLVEVTGIRPDFDSEGVLVGETTLISDYSTSKAKEKILFDYVPLRDAAVALSVAQLSGSDDEVKAAQALTLGLYESFVKSHGSANARKVVLAIQDDPRSSEVLALENYDQDKGIVNSLAETLYKKVVGSVESAKIETAADAYYVCIDRKGSIDFDYMAELSGLDPVDIRNELLGSLVFLNPKTNEIESATTYLTGNVVEKLFEAEQAALNDAQLFESNIAALQRVRPLLLPFEDISINLGANWIPPNDIRLFVSAMCNKSSVSQREVNVSYNEDIGVWKVDASTTFEKNNEIAMRSRFGTANIKFTKLLEMSLNGKKPSHYYKNGDGKMVLDHEATMESRAKQDDIQEAFVGWVSGSDERKSQYAKYYNEKINVITPPKADGSRITFAGMASTWKPRAHQSDVVAMGLMGNNIMAAHPVGSGKTFEMVALSIKLKQVGMSSKPMISVPNHMLAQMSREAKEIFPAAKVLMVTNEDLSLKNRKRFFAVARNNDWDLIVCTHSMLDRLQAPFNIKLDSVEGELLLARRQLETAETNNQKRILATKIQTIQSKLDKMIADNEEAQIDPAKTPMLISDIGVDTLLVDEAHLYKNLFLNTGMQVLGISQAGSQRASNLLEISQYLRELHGKCAGLHFFTGTPIANSVAELYVHNRFLRPDIFESMGINTFDQWALNFGKTVDKAEVLADGSSIGIRTRFSEFQNLPELIKLFRTFADVRTHAELNLPTPKLKSNTVIVEQTQLGKDHMIHLGIRAVATRNQGKAEKGMDNILNIATDGRKAALDLQMIDHRLPDDASNKLMEVAKNIMAEWSVTHEQKGAQLVFMDLGTPGKKGSTETDKRFSGYDKLKDILVESGMPREQIAFIHDAKNDTQKDAIFRAVRSGDIRVLIGSTLKMGVGTNVQERLCALHNVDCPWRPDQLEQRIGRIMRQGNLYFDEVTEHRYVTKDSIELFMYQKLETKDKFIKQAMASPDMADRVMSEEVDAGYGDIMASATGEVRIKEKFETDANVESLERRKRSWVREQAYVRDRVGEMRRDISKMKSNIESYRAVQQALPKSTYKAITVRGSVFAVQDGDTTWLSATEAGIAIKTRLDTVAAMLSRSNERSQPLKVNIGDIELMVERNGFKEDVIFADLNGRSVPKFSIKETKNPQSLGKSIRSLYSAGAVIKDDQAQIKVVEDNISRSPAVQMSWPLQDEYESAVNQKKELDAWFVKQDFDKRFEGIADPFLIKLDEAIAAHEQKNQMDDEPDMELFNGAGAEEADDLEQDFDLGCVEDFDNEAIAGSGDGDGQQRVANRVQSMGL